MSLFGLGFVVQLVNARALFQCVLLVFVGIFSFLVLCTLANSFHCRCSRLLGSRSSCFRGECKPRIEMGKMVVNGPGILALLTPRSLKFLKGAAVA